MYELAQQCLALKFSLSDVASYETDEALLAEVIAAHEGVERVVDKYTSMLNYSPTNKPQVCLMIMVAMVIFQSSMRSAKNVCSILVKKCAFRLKKMAFDLMRVPCEHHNWGMP